jgi:hypothetical protein
MAALAIPVLFVLLAPAAAQAAQTSFFTITATPATVTAGTAFTFTVTAIDVFNAVATGYTGTVHFTSTDVAASLPADATLTNGVGMFSATLKTTGPQTITETDTVTAAITGTSNTILVDPLPVTAVPTLSQWNLALMGILLAGLAMLTLKARPGAGAA